MRYDSSEIINFGSGIEQTMKEMAVLIKKISGYEGEIVFDETKPDGTPRKLLNVEKISRLGWKAAIDLEDGLKSTYQNFKENYDYYTGQTLKSSPVIMNV